MANKKITQLDAVTSLVDADLTNVVTDVSTTPTNKKITWANIKATLKTYFDTLYASLTAPIKETSGPTVLTTGAIADGEYLVRSGTTLIGGTPAGGGGAVTNLLINGGFDFFQRIEPATATAMSDDVYNAPDMWYSLIQGANATINRNAGIGTSKYSCKLVAGGTTNRHGIAQIIESTNSIPLRGKEVIAQCLVKPVNNAGSGTRDYRIAILEWTGTSDSVTSEIVADWTSGIFTTAGFFASTTLTLVATASVTATHNIESQLSCTGTVSTSCNNIIVFIWTEDVPTHASDYVLIGEAGLYISGTIQKWSPRPLGAELDLCQRFCEKSYDLDTAPQTNTVISMYGTTAQAISTTIIDYIYVYFKTIKFGVPTVTTYRRDGSGTNPSYWRWGGSAYGAITTAPGTKSFGAYITTTGLTSGNFYLVDGHYIAVYEL